MRDDVWRAAVREPYGGDDRVRDDRPSEPPGSNLVGIVMIVAGAAAVVAIMAISVATCGTAPGGGRLVAAAMAVWALAFAGTCAIAYRRRAWLSGATVVTACAALIVLLAAYDHATAQERFSELTSRGMTCDQIELDGD